jgi:hypothetical protein
MQKDFIALMPQFTLDKTRLAVMIFLGVEHVTSFNSTGHRLHRGADSESNTDTWISEARLYWGNT